MSFKKICLLNLTFLKCLAIPTCQCFTYYSGADCELKSEELVAMKKMSSAASSTAVVTMSGMYVTFMVMDYLKFAHMTIMAIFA